MTFPIIRYVDHVERMRRRTKATCGLHARVQSSC